jgi:hypothetical protein
MPVFPSIYKGLEGFLLNYADFAFGFLTEPTQSADDKGNNKYTSRRKLFSSLTKRVAKILFL